MFGKRAAAFSCTFRATESLALGFPIVRTGQPVREELRRAATSRVPSDLVLVVGGSQGSQFLNEVMPRAYPFLDGNPVTHATGRANIEAVRPMVARFDAYDATPYLERPALVRAYQTAGVVLGRSGGTLAEFAVFRLPSVLIPLPTAADDHQAKNAQEFHAMGAASMIEQDRATPEAVAAALRHWLDDGQARAAAETALAEWDIPDATARIVDLLEKAAGR
jgi:UDP-N-acetylglucosamine--N-acetylmuramyl-(pentapeptide) pyrophosphoryl-undecaprenol N-acetylglucosamine transferase